MSDDLAQLAAQLGVLTAEIRGLRRDVSALQQSDHAMRDEFRDELAQLRNDLTLITGRQNSAIQDNKKKSPELGRLSVVSTGD